MLSAVCRVWVLADVGIRVPQNKMLSGVPRP